VPLLVIPLLNVGVIAALSVQLAPASIVTNPPKVLAGFVADEKAKVPDTPPPTVVVPVTPSVKAPTVKVVPSPTERLPLIAKLAPVVDVAVPLTVRFPAIVVTVKVFTPLPESVK